LLQPVARYSPAHAPAGAGGDPEQKGAQDDAGDHGKAFKEAGGAAPPPPREAGKTRCAQTGIMALRAGRPVPSTHRFFNTGNSASASGWSGGGWIRFGMIDLGRRFPGQSPLARRELVDGLRERGIVDE